MAQEVRADLLLGRDTLSPGLIKAGRAAADAGGNVKDLQDDLRRLSGRTYDARLGLKGDKETGQSLDKLTAQLIRLGQRKVDPEVDPEGFLRARAQITGLELALDRLGAKKTRIQIAVDKVAGLGFLQPSLLGTAVALLPTLIPLTAGVAAGAVAVGASFGAAAAGVAGFGLMAKTVLAGAGQDMAKLQALNVALLKATTPAAKKAAEQAIAALKAGWSKGYLELIDQYQKFQTQWKSVSQAITVPTLNVWLPVLTRGLQFLKPLIKPIADAFTLWGISLNTYFRDPAAAKHIKGMAAAFGNFAAQQLFHIGQFIKDIGQGVFNLGKDLASSGANFSSFGVWLSGIGDAFLNWSKSKKARDDVHRFMKFLHDEGPVVTGILGDLKKILPGIFAGATTVGTLELQALGNFLNLVASLPPGWQKPLTEFAGAMLLLSKIGVISVGIKLVGLGVGAAGGGLNAAAAAAGAAMAAGVVLKFKEDVKKGMKDAGLVLGRDLGQVLSGLGGFAATGAQGLAETLVNHFSKEASKGFHAVWHEIEASFGAFRHAMSASFAVLRHDLSASFAALRHDLAASARQAWHDIASSFAAFRHTMSASFAAFRHDTAAAWDTVWRNTVTRARNGISDVVGWFRTLPGRAVGALFGLGHRLYAFAHAAFNEFWSGFKAVGGAILRWLGGFVSRIIGLVKRVLHIGSPSAVFHDIGANMMLGLERGIKATAHRAANAARSAAMSTTAAGAAGAGVQRWRGTVLKALHMEHLPASLVNDVLYQMQTESGGNPDIVNTWDSNARAGMPSTGLMQVIWPTFAAYHWPGTSWSLTDPLANIAAALNYAAHNRGFGSGPGQIGSGHGYDSGGWLPVGVSLAINRTGRPERVLSPRESYGGTATIIVRVDPTVAAVTPDRQLGRHIADHILAHVRSGGRLYPPGISPR